MPFTHFAETNNDVEVKASSINNAGDGLFATKDFKKGDFICWYNGVFIEPPVIENGYYDSDYLLKIPGSDLYIDAEDPLSCYGRFINDGLSKKNSNCKFIDYDDVYAAGVIATRKIKQGDEIFVSYGHDYWIEPRRNQKLSQKDKDYVTNLASEIIYLE